MTFYLVVASWLASGITITSSPALFNTQPETPAVAFFISRDNAVKEYAKHGKARIFSVTMAGWRFDDPDGTCIYKTNPAMCVNIKELNVLPAQTYEVSDKGAVGVSP